MRVVSDLQDKRIDSRNLLVELSIEDYLSFAEEIVHKNEFQRRRVRSSGTIYSLLKEDLKRGCIIPPVVLALTSDITNKSFELEGFGSFLSEQKSHLVILDGLQRTYTIMDLVNEIKEQNDENALKDILSLEIRAEFYVGLNRLGILYRMLTLNTGQTPMSLRQQIEILYLDYTEAPIGDIELIREVEEKRITRVNQYNFKEIVEGFNSYLERNELPIDRADLLENIKGLEKLAKENKDIDLFVGYVKAWHAFVAKVTELCGELEVPEQFVREYGLPFGKNAQQIFKKSQAISGFGAAVGRLKDFEIISGFEEIEKSVANITTDNPEEMLLEMNRSLDWIKQNTKKIGNAQRSYFQYFFREILNPENDNYLILDQTVTSALHKYQTQNL